MSMVCSNQDKSPEFWITEGNHLETMFNKEINRRIEDEATPAHFSVFTLASMPLLIKLGALFTDKIDVDVYQPIREPKTWKWREYPEGFEFIVKEPDSYNNPPAFVVSQADKISYERVYRVIENPSYSVGQSSVNDNNHTDSKHSKAKAFRLFREADTKMNLSQVGVIVEIAKAGSISQAAQNMYISQPGVSKILQRFEEEVGAQIFERGSTGIRLTPIGRRFVENAQDIIEQVDKLEELFKKKSMPAMELNIASMSYRFMQNMLSELYIKYSQNPINIKYTECGFDDELELISKGDIEIGIVTLWKNDRKKAIKKALAKGVEYHRLGAAVPHIGVSKKSKKYPEGTKGLDLQRLATMPIVTISPSSPLKVSGWDFIRLIFGRNKLDSSYKEITTNNTGTMREIVNQIDGFSLIILNKGIYERYGFVDDIRLIPIPDESMQFELGWLQRANTVRSPLANEFISILSEYSSED